MKLRTEKSKTFFTTKRCGEAKERQKQGNEQLSLWKLCFISLLDSKLRRVWAMPFNSTKVKQEAGCWFVILNPQVPVKKKVSHWLGRRDAAWVKLLLCNQTTWHQIQPKECDWLGRLVGSAPTGSSSTLPNHPLDRARFLGPVGLRVEGVRMTQQLHNYTQCNCLPGWNMQPITDMLTDWVRSGVSSLSATVILLEAQPANGGRA